MNCVVSDSTTLIVLSKIGRFDLLCNIWERVFVPQEVWEEVNAKPFVSHPVIEIVEAPCDDTHQALSLILDAGESAAIALAHREALMLIIDEKKGRKWAKNIGVRVIGLIGILLINLERSLITPAEVREIIGCCDGVGFRISTSVKERVETEIRRYE